MQVEVVPAEMEKVSAAHQVFAVTELLECVLGYLSLGDLLYNAQAVSPFWKECIHGSRTLQGKSLLNPEIVDSNTADERLFMHSDCEARVIMDRDNRPYEIPRLRKIRRRVAKNPQKNHFTYMEQLAFFYACLGEDKLRFDANCKSASLEGRATQIKISAVHPFLELGLWSDNHCFWTGYKHHGILYILNKLNGFPLSSISDIILRMLETVQNCPTATWIDSSISLPAFTQVTVSIVPFRFRKLEPYCVRSTYRSTGITIRDLLRAIAEVAISALESYEDFEYRRAWGGVVPGAHEHLAAQKAEDIMQGVRKDSQPGILAAKDLRTLLG